jgi:alkylation response protein AidB-like acyl-CoA dehydrogenase
VHVPAQRIGVVAFDSTFMLSTAAYILASVLGAAIGAREETNRLFASGGNRFGSKYAIIAESPGARHLLAEATELVDDALDRTLRLCAVIGNGEIATPLQAARVHAGFASAAKDACTALEHMVDLHGTRGMASTHPVQRFWRDAAVATRHALEFAAQFFGGHRRHIR